MHYLNQTIRKLIHAAGFDIRRLTPETSPIEQLLISLKQFDIDLVFDIGANIGQFASELRVAGYLGNIVSFEPLQDASKTLHDRASGQDSNWQVHPRSAVGDYDGEIEINISGNSVSSSVLPMMEAHSEAALDSAYIASETVPICRLDTVAPEYISDASRYFIKIDTQGFESQVLDGAAKTLADAQGVLCELSLVPLYKGQSLWRDMIERFQNEGFVLWSLQQGFVDPRDGRSLQLDAVFFRAQNI